MPFDKLINLPTEYRLPGWYFAAHELEDREGVECVDGCPYDKEMGLAAQHMEWQEPQMVAWTQ